MTHKQLNKMMFFYYDNKMYPEVIKSYEKYDYIAEDSNPEILNLISKCLVHSDEWNVMDNIKKIGTLKSTDNFPDIPLLQCALAVRMYDEGRITFEELMSFDKNKIDDIYKNNPVFYFSPGIDKIDLQKSDPTKELLFLLQRNMDNKEFFVKNVVKLQPPLQYQEMISFSLKHDEYEYGFEAAKKLVAHFEMHKSEYNISKWKTDLSPYVLVVDFMKHFQQYGKKFLNSDLYESALKIFKDTPIEISIIAVSIIEETKEIAIKKLNDCVARLKLIYEPEEITKYSDPFMRLLANIKK